VTTGQGTATREGPSAPRGEESTAPPATDGIRDAGSVVLGGALLAYGGRRRGLVGTASAVAGGWLLYRSASGRGRGRTRMGADSHGETATSAGGDRPRRSDESGRARVERSVTVGRPAEELHGYWRDPQHLDRILGDLAEVTAAGEDRTRWRVSLPLGAAASWELRLAADSPDTSLRWTTSEGATVPVEWTVRFDPAPGDRGTEVRLALDVDPPGGAVGRALLGRAGLLPAALVGRSLRRFKSLAETGEIPTLDRNPSGRGRGDLV